MNRDISPTRKMINRDFRSPLLILSAILCIAAVVCSIPGIALLFDRETTTLYQAFMSLDYIDDSAQQSWLFVRGLVNVLAMLVPLIIGIGLIAMICSTFARPAEKLPLWGINFFSAGAKIFRIVAYAVGVILAIMFVFRALRYIIINGAQTGGILFIFAMLLPECVFLAVVAIIFALMFRCLKSVSLTVDTLQLNILTGKHESYGLTPGAVWLIVMIGAAACVLCVTGEEMAAKLCFGCSALADFSLAIWLLGYRKKNGKRALEQFRQEKTSAE